MLYLDGKHLSAWLSHQPEAPAVSELVKLPVVQQQVKRFLTQNCEIDLQQCKIIHVLQGESAVVDIARESADIALSSLEATTCCIVGLACRNSGRYAIAHFDEPRIRPEHFLHVLLEGMVSADLYIVGGYCEDSCVGHAVSSAILKAAHAADIPLHLQLAAVSTLNTNSDGSPKFCNLALRASHQEEHRVLMPQPHDKGPELMARMARQWLQPSQELVQLYDSSQQAITIPAVPVRLSDQQVHSYNWLLSLADDQFLQLMSTSPQHEAATFATEMRGMLEWLLKRCANNSPDNRQKQTFHWTDSWTLKT